MSGTPEFSRTVDLRGIGDAPVVLTANEAERAALAERFGLVAIHRLEASVTLTPDGAAVDARGALAADIVQSCAVSGDELPVTIREDLALRFVPANRAPAAFDEEIELAEDELDDIPFVGTSFDLGEAVAQSLALAIDPFAEGPNAEAARRAHGLAEEGAAGPLAEALRGLKND